jgi:hypothetical protein
MSRYLKKRLPRKDAEAPIIIKTKENPMIYASVEKKTLLRISLISLPVSSSKE